MARTGLDSRRVLWITHANNGMQASTDLAATYAALILADDGIEITVRVLLIVRWLTS